LENIEIERADKRDAQELAEISKRAFHTDIMCGGQGEGGPPGFDSPEWQAWMIGQALYYKILSEGKMIGGAVVLPKGEGRYYLGRIFIDPQCHRRGMGSQAMERIFREFPEARSWTLETPPWNNRTAAFYTKLGFKVVGRTADDVFFEKVVP
jgi:ribosomal protein S18 acetylase RimI-like enzyme